MITCRYAFCAETVIADRDTNRTSAINLVENVVARSFPFAFAKIHYYMLFDRQSEDPMHADLVFRLKKDDKEEMSNPVRIDFGQKLSCRSTVRINGFSTDTPCVLAFEVADQSGKIISSMKVPVFAKREVEQVTTQTKLEVSGE